MSKVNYVVIAWSGENRACGAIDDRYIRDRTTYIRNNLEQLSKLKHNLAQITIVLPSNPEAPQEFINYVYSIKDINGTPVEILEVENYGWSYIPFDKAFKKFPNFDYYIFIEDDYLFVQDNFDSLMVNIMESSPEVGYMCSKLVLDGPYNTRAEPAAAVSNGIITRRAMEKKIAKQDEPNHDWWIGNGIHQVEFSKAFNQVGVVIKDFEDRFTIPFWWCSRADGCHLEIYHPEGKEELITPIQKFLNYDYKVEPPRV